VAELEAMISLSIKRKAPDNGPTLIAFPEGAPRVEPDDIMFELYEPKDSKNDKHKKRILASETTFAFHRATNFSSEAKSQKDVSKFAIGVVSKSNGKMTLVDVPSVFALKQTLKRDVGLKAADEKEKKTLSSEEWVAQQRALVEEFGSKKAKRIQRSRAANKVVLQAGATLSAVEAVLDTQHEMPSEEAETINAIKAAQLPPYDDKTDKLEEVYPLNGIISEDEWKIVDFKAFLKILKNPESVANHAADLSRFVVHRLTSTSEKVKASEKNKGALKNIARSLMYLQYLLEFWSIPAGNKFKSLKENESIPDVIKEQFLQKFMARQQVRDRSKLAHTDAMKAKLLSYICVLALIVSNYDIDAEGVDSLADDLKKNTTELKVYFKEVGASIKVSGVSLSAPLKLPGFRKKRQNKGRQ